MVVASGLNAQVPTGVAAYAQMVGGSGAANEPGWTETTEEGNGFSFKRHTRGSITVELYLDGTFRFAENTERREAAYNMAKQDSAVTVSSEAQAYQLAEAALQEQNLWRSTMVRTKCVLGATTRDPSQNSKVTDGLATLDFEDIHNGAKSMEGGTSVELNRFNGEIISVFGDHPLTYPSGPPTMTGAQAKAAATTFVNSTSDLTGEEKSALLASFQETANNGVLVYYRDPDVTQWTAIPKYQFVTAVSGAAVGIEVDASTGSCMVGFRSRAAGATLSKTVPNKSDSPNSSSGENSKTSTLVVGSIIAAVGIAFAVARRRSRAN